MDYSHLLIALFANLSLIFSSELGEDVPLLSSRANLSNIGLGPTTSESGPFSILRSLLGVRTKRQHLAFVETEHVANKIHAVFKLLKSFIHKTYFAHLEFKDQMATFELDLLEISRNYHAVFQENERLRFRFDFTSTLLSALKRATHDMEAYIFLGERDHQLLNHMIELNVRLFAFHDSIGQLDYSIPMYASRINTCWNQLFLWTEAFYKIPDTSDEIRQVFEYHRIRVYSKIAEFWKQIPRGLHEF